MDGSKKPSLNLKNVLIPRCVTFWWYPHPCLPFECIAPRNFTHSTLNKFHASKTWNCRQPASHISVASHQIISFLIITVPYQCCISITKYKQIRERYWCLLLLRCSVPPRVSSLIIHPQGQHHHHRRPLFLKVPLRRCIACLVNSLNYERWECWAQVGPSNW